MADSITELSQAYAAFSKGSLDESSRLCANVLGRDARHAGALHLAAAIALRRGDPALALERIGGAIGSRPGDALQHQTRGLALRALRRDGDAEADFREAMRLAPAMPDPHASLGFGALERGEVDSAQRHFQEALRLGSQAPEVLNALGGIFAQRDQLESAANAFDAALRIQPRMSHSWNNLGTVRMAQGRLAEAQQCFERCLVESPGDPSAWSNLGNALRRAGRVEDAERAYREATTRAPDAAIAWQNLGNFLREEARLPQAIDCLERAVALSGLPGAHFSLAIVLLQSGELERGWNEYRWRHGMAPSANERGTLAGAISAGRPIELRGEQGLGDELFFLRWAPRLRPAAPLRWRGDARLGALLGRTGLFGDFGSPSGDASSPAVSIAVGDLPALVGHGGADLPPPLPLQADTGALEAARSILRRAGPPPYVAVAWRAGTPAEGPGDALSKNLPIDALGAALRPLAATVVSLQRQPRPGETQALARSLGRDVVDASEFNSDLARVTAMLAATDHYAGVSSTNTHIAAGLGMRASILVSRPWEWRYGGEGDTTPWFPRFRIHREDPRQGWGAALASLTSDLEERLRP